MIHSTVIKKYYRLPFRYTNSSITIIHRLQRTNKNLHGQLANYKYRYGYRINYIRIYLIVSKTGKYL